MRGKCIEEFEVGQVDESRARTVTETDVVTFSWVSGDVNPMHTDAVHSAKSPVGQRIAHGALGLSIATGLSASLGYLEGSAVAALGIDASRINVISYGKERPSALGSDEESWAQNRRAVTVTID